MIHRFALGDPDQHSKRLLYSHPHLDRTVGIDRLGHVYPQDGAFHKTEPSDIESKSHAKGLSHISKRVALDIGITYVIKRRDIDIPQSSRVVDDIPLQAPGERNSPLQTAHPNQAALPLLQIETAKQIPAAEREVFAFIGQADSGECPTRQPGF